MMQKFAIILFSLTFGAHKSTHKIIMKNKLTPAFCLITLLFSLALRAQPVGHLTVFSDEGDKFFLILNGERQNNVAQTNMRVEDLTQPQYSTKIIFEDQTLGEISKTLFLADESGTLMDVTYKIKHDKNGKPKLGALPFSFIPVRQGFVAPSNVYVVHFGTPPPVAATTVTQTTTTQTTANTVGTNVNVGGVGVNVTITDPLLGGTQTTTTQTTTTTTGYHQTEVHEQEVPHGCKGAYAMSSADFSSALSTVKNQGFDETRLKTAKQIASGNCLNTSQISQICQVFGFEETKLDFAKFAYDHCTESQNYFKINNIFAFSSSSDALNEYIQGRQ
jgi:hypothetical protein